MRKLATLLSAFLILCSYSFSQQIEIDGDMLDWVGIAPLDTGIATEATGEIPTYPDFDLKHLYITHDTANVYVKIDLVESANFSNFFNYDNPPVFEFYMDTEIGDTTGFDWGWWNIAMNYYVNLAPTLSPDSTDKHGELYLYNGNRNPTYAEGEFEFLANVPMAINSEGNSVEFSIPRELVNFGSEFRPWVYSVANFEWDAGADQLPDASAEYMLKYDFWYGASAYQHVGTQINSDMQIDGDMLDWVGIQPADQGKIAEELGDMPTGKEFDLQDFYITSDSNNLYIRIDIDPSATFSGMYTNYSNPPAFQLMFDVNWGDTTGLGYGGFWRLALDYMVDLSEALSPDYGSDQAPIYKYVADYDGAYEEFVPVVDGTDTLYATFAKNGDDNEVEIAIPRKDINVDTDVRPWLYVVGDEIWDNEEYFPNTIVEGWGGEDNEYYALNYNFISGPSVHRLGDSKMLTGVEKYNDNPNALNGFGLVRNYPNPFNPSTNISFTLNKQSKITIEVFNILGKKISTLISNKEMPAGHREVRWNGKDDAGNVVPSGVYIYKLSSDESFVTQKMMLLK